MRRKDLNLSRAWIEDNDYGVYLGVGSTVDVPENYSKNTLAGPSKSIKKGKRA